MIIDLTLPLTPGMTVYPGDPETVFKSLLTYGANEFSLHSLTMSSHAGTHIDAPYHAVPEGRKVDDAAVLAACVGPAHMVRIEGRENTDIVPDDLGETLDSLTEGDRLIIATGWSSRFGSPDYYKAHPRISPALASALAVKRPALLGIDIPSVHTFDDTRVHRILLAAGIVVVENLTNLDRLPESFFFSAAPLRLCGIDGSPVRAYAIVK